jgi:predicted MFS family arabinose efflux permease
VRPDDLIVANTLFNVTWSVMLAVGAAIGGLVATFLNAEIALLFDSVSFVIGAALIYAIRVYKAEPAPAHVSENAAPTEKTTFRDGLRYLRQRPELASVLWVKFGNSLGNVDTLMTIYATQLFVLGNDGQLSLGIMYGTFGLGAIAGPVLLNRFNDGSVARIRRLITIGFIFTTVCWLVMGAATSLWVFCIGLFIRGMGGSANWTYSSIVVQKLGEDRYLGRVFSLDMMGFYAATILSTVVHGGMVDLVGSENTYVVALGTILVALPAMVVWMVMNRWLARSQRFAAEELQTAAAD